MKRDWDLIRKQLTDIEEDNELFADLPPEPTLEEQEWDEYEKQMEEYSAIENRIFGHLELLVESGYIDGLTILRSSTGSFHYGLHAPRLTMEGHDLLDTIRSKTIWETIKANAKSKGIALTFDAIQIVDNNKIPPNPIKAGYCLGLINGISDEVNILSAVANKEGPFCRPKNSQLSQLVRVVIKYANEHPEELHLRDSLIVNAALIGAFPCPH